MLICDLAEVYGILEYKKLPLTTVAHLFYGLSDNSRSKRLLTGEQTSIDTLLLATIADRLGLLLWAKTKDGQKGRNRPKSIVEKMTTPKENDIKGYFTGEDYEKVRDKILNERG